MFAMKYRDDVHVLVERVNNGDEAAFDYIPTAIETVQDWLIPQDEKQVLIDKLEDAENSFEG